MARHAEPLSVTRGAIDSARQRDRFVRMQPPCLLVGHGLALGVASFAELSLVTPLTLWQPLFSLRLMRLNPIGGMRLIARVAVAAEGLLVASLTVVTAAFLDDCRMDRNKVRRVCALLAVAGIAEPFLGNLRMAHLTRARISSILRRMQIHEIGFVRIRHLVAVGTEILLMTAHTFGAVASRLDLVPVNPGLTESHRPSYAQGLVTQPAPVWRCLTIMALETHLHGGHVDCGSAWPVDNIGVAVSARDAPIPVLLVANLQPVIYNPLSRGRVALLAVCIRDVPLDDVLLRRSGNMLGHKPGSPNLRFEHADQP